MPRQIRLLCAWVSILARRHESHAQRTSAPRRSARPRHSTHAAAAGNSWMVELGKDASTWSTAVAGLEAANGKRASIRSFAAVHDSVEDHLLTPRNSAQVIIHYQPVR